MLLQINYHTKGSASSRNATTTRTTTSSSSPTDTVGSTSAAESPVFLGAVDLAYDPHSSEEELEVINGATAVHQFTAGDSDVFDDSPRRSCSSTINVENRKRSLAQSSEDEVRLACIYILDNYYNVLIFLASELWRALPHSSQFSHFAATRSAKTAPHWVWLSDTSPFPGSQQPPALLVSQPSPSLQLSSSAASSSQPSHLMHIAVRGTPTIGHSAYTHRIGSWPREYSHFL